MYRLIQLTILLSQMSFKPSMDYLPPGSVYESSKRVFNKDVLAFDPSYADLVFYKEFQKDANWKDGIDRTRKLLFSNIVEHRPVGVEYVGMNYPLTENNHIKTRIGTRASWFSEGGIFSSIAKAKHSINIMMYGWRTDTIGNRLLDELCRASFRGVSVNVVLSLIDDRPYRAAFRKRSTSARCRQGGDPEGKAMVLLKPVQRRWGSIVRNELVDMVGRYDHRKLWIIDGNLGFIGGYTVNSEMAHDQYDILLELRGPIVHQMQSTFWLSVAYNNGVPAEIQHRTGCTRGGCQGALRRIFGNDQTALRAYVKEVIAGYFPVPEDLYKGPNRRGFDYPLTLIQANPMLDIYESVANESFPGKYTPTWVYMEMVRTANGLVQMATPYFSDGLNFIGKWAKSWIIEHTPVIKSLFVWSHSGGSVDMVMKRYAESFCSLNIDFVMGAWPEQGWLYRKLAGGALERGIKKLAEIQSECPEPYLGDATIKLFYGGKSCYGGKLGDKGRLHAKVMLNDQGISLGSTNMDFLTRHTLEANVYSDDRRLIKKVHEDFFSPINDDGCAYNMNHPSFGDPQVDIFWDENQFLFEGKPIYEKSLHRFDEIFADF